MTNRIRQYRDLMPGDVFTINHEKDGRQYMKLGDYGAIDVNSREDCIPALFDRCSYLYTVNVDNSLTKRKA